LAQYTESLVRRTAKAKDLGFHAAKLEICIHGPYSHNSLQVSDDRAIATIVRECRAAVGSGMTMMVDVAYCWQDWKAALRAIDMFADQDVFFVETPLPSDDVYGYAKLRGTSPVRIAAGEWLSTRFEFREFLDRDALDVVQPDVGRVGGLTEARRVASMARDRGVLVVPHCWKSGIGIAASVHLAIVTPHCSHIEFLPSTLADSRLRKDLVRDELTVVDGRILPPMAPGLGVVVDDEVLRRFRVQ
jgi:L-alanine-DL-glutamate epimerase-like enolase superfamily enzyme